MTNIYSLCNKPPTELSQEEVESIVAFLREERKRILKLEAAGKKPAARKLTETELNDLLRGL